MKILCLLFLSSFLTNLCLSEKIEAKIYGKIDGVSLCALLTNATHQIGCTSERGGNLGVLHLISNNTDLNWMIEKGKHHTYIPLLTASMFTRNVMDKLMVSKKISGALVIEEETQPLPSEGFSPDSTCPMDEFGLYSKHKEYKNCQKVKWNIRGNGMSFVYYGIPIFLVRDKKYIALITECYEKHNKPDANGHVSYPLCSAELKDFMYAAKDTPTCKRKTNTPALFGSVFCDELEDKNVYGTLYPMVGTIKKNEVIMAATRMDSTAFFHDVEPAADNGASGLVTLLAAAYILGEYKRNMTSQNITENLRPIAFSIFNGETWDYIGSSKMVYDMEKEDFPYSGANSGANFNRTTTEIPDDVPTAKLNLSNIGHFLEISQVGLTDEIYLHTDPVSQENNADVKNQVSKLVNTIKAQSKLPIKIADEARKQPLPPASFQRFLRKRMIPGVVFADHEKNFTNKYYNSRFDNKYNLGYSAPNTTNSTTSKRYPSVSKKLGKVALALAKTLYKLALDGKEPQSNYTFTVPDDLTDNLLRCFLDSGNCTIFNEAADNDVIKFKVLSQMSSKPFNRYISVGRGDNLITIIIGRLLAYYTGEWIDYSQCANKNKNSVFTYNRVLSKNLRDSNNYMCVKHSIYYTPAVSPAFELKDYTSTEYSTWAESIWSSEAGVRIYLKIDPRKETIVLVCGLLMFALTFLLAVFIKRRISILFTSNLDETSIINR